MNALGAIVILLVIDVAVIFVTTSHLREMSPAKDRAAASIALFFISWFLVGVSGMHMCQEGRPPAYIAFLFAFLVSATPWFRFFRIWTIRCLIALFSDVEYPCRQLGFVIVSLCYGKSRSFAQCF